MNCPTCKTQVYWMYYYGWSCNCKYQITYSTNAIQVIEKELSHA
jgi:hypothetical protein